MSKNSWRKQSNNPIAQITYSELHLPGDEYTIEAWKKLKIERLRGSYNYIYSTLNHNRPFHDYDFSPPKQCTVFKHRSVGRTMLSMLDLYFRR